MSTVWEEQKAFQCQECQKCFPSKLRLRKHVYTHRKQKTHVCSYCTQSFKTKNVLDNHIRCHTGERPFSCTICSKSFKQRGHLHDHMKVHFPPEQVPCPHCHKNFVGEKNLKAHIRLRHDKQHACHVCSEKFGCPQEVTRHILAKHADENLNYNCLMCSAQCTSAVDLHEHLLIHVNNKKSQNGMTEAALTLPQPSTSNSDAAQQNETEITTQIVPVTQISVEVSQPSVDKPVIAESIDQASSLPPVVLGSEQRTEVHHIALEQVHIQHDQIHTSQEAAQAHRLPEGIHRSVDLVQHQLEQVHRQPEIHYGAPEIAHRPQELVQRHSSAQIYKVQEQIHRPQEQLHRPQLLLEQLHRPQDEVHRQQVQIPSSQPQIYRVPEQVLRPPEHHFQRPLDNLQRQLQEVPRPQQVLEIRLPNQLPHDQIPRTVVEQIPRSNHEILRPPAQFAQQRAPVPQHHQPNQQYVSETVMFEYEYEFGGFENDIESENEAQTAVAHITPQQSQPQPQTSRQVEMVGAEMVESWIMPSNAAAEYRSYQPPAGGYRQMIQEPPPTSTPTTEPWATKITKTKTGTTSPGSSTQKKKSPRPPPKPVVEQIQDASGERTINVSYSCVQCPRTFPDEERVAHHMKVCHNPNRKLHCCRYCNKTFGQRFSLRNHVLTHTQERPFSCPHCDKRFKQRGHLMTHEMIHTKVLPHKCEFCDKGFRLRSNVKTHIRMVHLNLRPFACHLCTLTYKDKKSLQLHVKTHELSEGNDARTDCPDCGKQFKFIKWLYKHKKVCQQEKEKKEDGRDYFKCNECGMAFRTMVYLQGHLNAKCNGFMCTKCKTTFQQMQGYMRHLTSSCTVEGKTARKKYMKRSCDVCGKQVSIRPNIWERHVKLCVQLGEHLCEICGKSLPHSRALKLHVKTHTALQVPKFQCSYCEQRFFSKTGIFSHLKNREKDGECKLGRRVFWCATCGTRTRKREQLEAHCSERGHLIGEDLDLSTVKTTIMDKDSMAIEANKMDSIAKMLEEHAGSEGEENLDEIFKEEVKKQKKSTSDKTEGDDNTDANELSKPGALSDGENPKDEVKPDPDLPYKRRNRRGQPYKRKQIPTIEKDIAKRLLSEKIEKCPNTGRKRWTCKECKKTYTGMDSIEAHMRIHTQERPYVCDECGASFKQRAHLYTHRFIHDRTLSKHRCEICQHVVASSTALRIHMKRTHDEDLPHKPRNLPRTKIPKKKTKARAFIEMSDDEDMDIKKEPEFGDDDDDNNDPHDSNYHDNDNNKDGGEIKAEIKQEGEDNVEETTKSKPTRRRTTRKGSTRKNKTFDKILKAPGYVVLKELVTLDHGAYSVTEMEKQKKKAAKSKTSPRKLKAIQYEDSADDDDIAEKDEDPDYKADFDLESESSRRKSKAGVSRVKTVQNKDVDEKEEADDACADAGIANSDNADDTADVDEGPDVVSDAELNVDEAEAVGMDLQVEEGHENYLDGKNNKEANDSDTAPADATCDTNSRPKRRIKTTPKRRQWDLDEAEEAKLADPEPEQPNKGRRMKITPKRRSRGKTVKYVEEGDTDVELDDLGNPDEMEQNDPEYNPGCLGESTSDRRKSSRRHKSKTVKLNEEEEKEEEEKEEDEEGNVNENGGDSEVEKTKEPVATGRTKGRPKRSDACEFQCAVCNKIFRSSDAFVNHQRIHTQERPFTCHLCGQSFKQRGHLYTHKLVHNATGNAPFVCSVCKTKYWSYSGLYVHMKKQHKMKVDKNVCLQGLKSLKVTKQNQGIKKARKKRPNVKNKNNESMVENLSNEEVKIQVASLPKVTSNVLNRMNVLNVAKLRHHYEPKETFTCGKCGLKFCNPKSFYRHSHPCFGNTRSATCMFCKDTWSHKELQTHYVRDHAGDKFPCKHCLKEFDHLKELNEHISKKECRLKKGSKQSQENQPCSFCELLFETFSALDRHLAKEHPGQKHYQCEKCDQQFVSYKRIKHHLSTNHPIGDPLMCETCGMLLKSQKQLNSHMNLEHRAPSYMCDKCGMSFKLKHRFAQHVKTNKCSKIPKAKIQKSPTKTIKRFECSLCNRKYKVEADFLNHTYQHMKNLQG